MRPERGVTRADKHHSRIATGLLLAGAVGPCWACSTGVVNLMTAPREKLTFACRNTAAFTDEPGVDAVAYEGSVRDRSMMAVLVVPRLPYGWRLQVKAVDSRSTTQTCKPTPTEASPNADTLTSARPGECLRLVLPTGNRDLRMLAASKASGDSIDGTYVKGAYVLGPVSFDAKANGLYSVHVCAPADSKVPLFWVRDERTNSCVSAPCPVLEED